MFYDWSTERLVAFATFCVATIVSSNKTINLGPIEKYALTESLIKGVINLLFALILFLITHYLKKWLSKKSKKTLNQ